MSNSIKQMTTLELEDTLAAIQSELKNRQEFSDMKSRLVRLKLMTEAQVYRFIQNDIFDVVGNDRHDLDPLDYEYSTKLINDCILYTYNHLQTTTVMEDYMRPLPKPIPKSKPKT